MGAAPEVDLDQFAWIWIDRPGSIGLDRSAWIEREDMT